MHCMAGLRETFGGEEMESGASYNFRGSPPDVIELLAERLLEVGFNLRFGLSRTRRFA